VPNGCFSTASSSIATLKRTYVIHVLRDLPGFAGNQWRTGFTNYRFAIPSLVAGKAIYNDVDQIYLDDPAKLFDLPLGEAGFLALSADDTAVMLLDSERMRPFWNLESARHTAKKALLQGAARALWGPLPQRWHARDLEYRPGHTAVLHYTLLHRQPWCPTPQRYSYHPHPLGHLWFALEKEMAQAGFMAFAPGSALVAKRLAADQLALSPHVDELHPQCWPAAMETALGSGTQDILFTLRQHNPLEPWLHELLVEASQRHPQARWTLARPAQRQAPSRAVQRFRLQRRTPAEQASRRVLVLLGRHAGDNHQLKTLANALDGEVKSIQLEARRSGLPHVLRCQLVKAPPPCILPWPDMVLFAGRRMVPAALALKQASGGHARLVALGRPAAPLSWFDLILTTPQYGLPAHPHVVHLPLPIRQPSPTVPEEAMPEDLARLPRPWTAVLLGGPTAALRLDEAVVRRLGRQLCQLVDREGGAVLLSCGPRTPANVVTALRQTLAEVPLHTSQHGIEPNHHRLYLAQADRFVVSADSATMLGEAIATGKPLAIAMLPAGQLPWWRRQRLRLLDPDRTILGSRNVPRQQRRRAHWRDALVTHGLLWPPRDMRKLHQVVLANGWAGVFGEGERYGFTCAAPAPDTLAMAAAAVEAMLLTRSSTMRLGAVRTEQAAPRPFQTSGMP
jgi:mitochondrial fission protein ELM1